MSLRSKIGAVVADCEEHKRQVGSAVKDKLAFACLGLFSISGHNGDGDGEELSIRHRRSFEHKSDHNKKVR